MTMGGIFWFLKGGLALVFTLANTLGMTPIWVVQAMLQRRSSTESPNGLQWYLTFSARAFLWWLAVLRAQPSPNTRTPSRLRDWLLCRRFAWVQPVSISQRRGTSTPSFDSSTLPLPLDEREASRRTAALWFLNPREQFVSGQLDKATRKSPVLLYFHGGAYITLEAGDIFQGLTLARLQAKHAALDVFSINYRLAPGSKYPSQLYEAFSGWCHLRRMGYSSILIGGDSAGANLALLLWRYLDEVARESQFVRGLVLHSPWLDMDGHRRPQFSKSVASCIVTPTYVKTGFKALQRHGLPTAQDGWISPIVWGKARLSRLPPVIVTNGGVETLMEEDTLFVRKARESGTKVEHFVMPDHPHDFGGMPWFASSSRKMFSVVGVWANGIDR